MHASRHERARSDVWSFVDPPRSIGVTPRDVVHTDGTAKLYRFRSEQGDVAPQQDRAPVLLVPSLINRWYVLDLRRGASLVSALVDAGHDVYCLDWGIAEDEDRYLSWEDVLARLDRTVRKVLRRTGASRVSLVGYCMGATLSAIYTALHGDRVASLVNLAGPIDFSKAGVLATMVDKRWFDVNAISDAGNLAPAQMQSGFTALRPTQGLAKMIGLWDRGDDPKAKASFEALEAWANDNVPFPAEAYRRYISALYQHNELARGVHRVGGAAVDLKSITCPVLVVGAERDAICPIDAAKALIDLCGATETETLVVPGGHVGAVVGSRAAKVLYPEIARFVTRAPHASMGSTAG
ncbi:MAG: alpha/beta fold hydrolase [Polyangiales bacterium]